MFFDGRTSNRREVSLRGNSRKRETKADLVEKARKQRELRDLNRRKLRSCVLLQSKVRAVMSRRQLRHRLRYSFLAEWDPLKATLGPAPTADMRDEQPVDFESMVDILEAHDGQQQQPGPAQGVAGEPMVAAPGGVPGASWRTVLRNLVFSFDPAVQDDQAKLAEVVQCALDARLLREVSAADPGMAWLVAGLCGLCALHLPIRVQPGPSVAFRLLSEIASLKATGQAALGAYITSHLVGVGVYDVLSATIRSHMSTTSVTYSPDARPPLAVAMALLPSCPPHLLASVARPVLSLPLIAANLSGKLLPPSLIKSLIRRLGDSSAGLASAPVSSRVWTVCNAVALALPSVPSWSLEDLTCLFNLVAQIRAPNTPHRALSDHLRSLAPHEQSAVRSSLQALASYPFAAAFTTLIATPRDPTNLTLPDPHPADVATDVALLLHDGLKEVGSQLINVLVFSPSLSTIGHIRAHLARPENFTSLAPPPRHAQRSGPAATPSAPASSPPARMLTLFCIVYSKLLAVVDDNDFFDKQIPLPLGQVVGLSRQLLVLTTRVLWSAGPQDDAPPQFLNPALRLLRLLRERDSRRSFCPPSHWEVTAEVAPQVVLRELVLRAQKIRDPDEIFPEYSNDVALEVDNEADANEFSARESQTFQNILKVLRHLPFVIPFEVRVQIFRMLIDVDREASARGRNRRIQSRLQQGFDDAFGGWLNGVALRANRGTLYEDGFTQLAGVPAESLKQPLRVTFVSSEGLDEAGIGQGVSREFVQLVLTECFNPQYGIFRANDDNMIHPSPTAHLANDNWGKHLEFAGRMLGKSVYEHQLVDLPLSRFFINQILQRHNSVSELPSLDAELYKSLMYVKTCPADEVSDLFLHFAISRDQMGADVSHDLKPGGSNVLVTAENRTEYIYLVAHYRLNQELWAMCEHVRAGLTSMIPPHWLHMFSADEFQLLVSGSQEPINVDDMRAHTEYSGGYSDDDPTIQHFWEVVKSYTGEQRRLLLKFATSSDRAPLMGFAHLHPRLCIQKSSAGTVAGHGNAWLPSSATCMNLIKLPPYDSLELTQEKLTYAISGSEGFELT